MSEQTHILLILRISEDIFRISQWTNIMTKLKNQNLIKDISDDTVTALTIESINLIDSLNKKKKYIENNHDTMHKYEYDEYSTLSDNVSSILSKIINICNMYGMDQASADQ